MEWFEYLIALAAIGLVILPIVLKIVNKKRGRTSSACGCTSCSECNKCYQNLRTFLKENGAKCK